MCPQQGENQLSLKRATQKLCMEKTWWEPILFAKRGTYLCKQGFNALYFGFVHNRWTNRAGEDVLHTELFISSRGRERFMLTHIHFWVFEVCVFLVLYNMFQYICTIYAYIAIYVYFLSIWYNIIIWIISIILPFVLLLLHSLPHHGDIEGNKNNQMYCILSYILIQTLRIWNENPIFWFWAVETS